MLLLATPHIPLALGFLCIWLNACSLVWTLPIVARFLFFGGNILWRRVEKVNGNTFHFRSC